MLNMNNIIVFDVIMMMSCADFQSNVNSLIIESVNRSLGTKQVSHHRHRSKTCQLQVKNFRNYFQIGHSPFSHKVRCDSNYQ